MATSSKIRSACDTCHRMKIRCSGQVPCEGCVNSGNLCFYSFTGRLGRPKGIKNRKNKDHNNQNDRSNNNCNASNGTNASGLRGPSENEKQPSSRSSRQHSPSRPLEHYNTQNPAMSQHTIQMTDNFVNDVHSSNNPMLDAMMQDPPYIFPFGETDSQQGQRFDTQKFDFIELFPAAGDAENFLGTAKDSLDMNNSQLVQNPSGIDGISIDEIIPKTPNTSPSPPIPDQGEGNDLAMNSIARKRSNSTSERPAFVSSQTSPGSCSCFQENAQLLCSFKQSESANDQAGHSVDHVLHSVQQGLKPWQSLIECKYCASRNDLEGMQLAFMAIRLVLLRLQQLAPPWNFQAASGSGFSIAKPGHPVETNNKWPPYGMPVTLGSFEVDDGDRTMLLQVLLLSAIRKIKTVMSCFKEMLERKQQALMSRPDSRHTKIPRRMLIEHGPGASDLDYMQHMLRGLATFAQNLEKSLRGDYLGVQSKRNSTTSLRLGR